MGESIMVTDHINNLNMLFSKLTTQITKLIINLINNVLMDFLDFNDVAACCPKMLRQVHGAICS